MRKSSKEQAKRRRVPLPVPTAWFSIPSFCSAHGFSEAFFHKLSQIGKGPRITKIGGRTFITHEDAAEWRARKAETAVAAE